MFIGLHFKATIISFCTALLCTNNPVDVRLTIFFLAGRNRAFLAKLHIILYAQLPILGYFICSLKIEYIRNVLLRPTGRLGLLAAALRYPQSCPSDAKYVSVCDWSERITP